MPREEQQTEATLEADAEQIPETAGRELVLSQPATRVIDLYHNIANVPISDEQCAKLAEPVDPDQLDILPTGEIYMSHIWYRKTLSGVFRPGKWALHPRGDFFMRDGRMYREYALIVNDSFLSEAVGGAEYHENSDRSSYDDVTEAVRSSALKRCCKDLGIAWECWDKKYTDDWRTKYAVEVYRTKAKKPYQWRRKDSPAFFDEKDAQPQTTTVRQAPAQQQPAAAPTVTRRSSAAPQGTPVQGSPLRSVAPINTQPAAQPAQQPAQPAPAKKPEVQRQSEAEQFHIQTKLKRNVYSKPTNNGGTRYGVQAEDGTWYNSYDKNIEAEANAVFQNGETCLIVFTRSGDWNNIVSLLGEGHDQQPASEDQLPF